MRSFILAVFLLYNGSVLAGNCDCTKVVGSCSGDVFLSEASGGHGSYHGEVTITSSASSCSKVEYYVNNTPYSTVLTNKNKDTENIFGTSPIRKNDIQFKACYVCLNQDSRSGGDSGNAMAANPFVGTWTGNISWLMVNNQITVIISDNNRVLSGSWQIQGKPVRSLTGVNVSGNVMTIHFIGDDNQSLTYVFTRNGISTADVKGLGLVSFSGVVHKSG